MDQYFGISLSIERLNPSDVVGTICNCFYIPVDVSVITSVSVATTTFLCVTPDGHIIPVLCVDGK